MNRRGFLRGIGATFIAAPAIVRASSLMTVRSWCEPFIPLDGTNMPTYGGFGQPQIYTASPSLVKMFQEIADIQRLMDDASGMRGILQHP